MTTDLRVQLAQVLSRHQEETPAEPTAQEALNNRLARFLANHQARHRHKQWAPPRGPEGAQAYRHWQAQLIDRLEATDEELEAASEAIRGKTRKQAETWYPEDHLDWLVEAVLRARTAAREEADRQLRRQYLAEGERLRRRRDRFRSAFDSMPAEDRAAYEREAEERIPACKSAAQLRRIVCLDLFAEEMERFTNGADEPERKQAG